LFNIAYIEQAMSTEQASQKPDSETDFHLEQTPTQAHTLDCVDYPAAATI